MTKDERKEDDRTDAGEEREPSTTMTSSKKLTGWRLFLTLPCILIGLFLATMDSSIVSTALVTIGNDFHNFIQTIWIVVGYLISYMTFALLWPSVSDVFGRKWSFIAACFALLIFSLGCAVSRTLEQLVLFRVLQGLGGSGMYSLGNMILPEMVPNKWYSFMLAAQGTILTLAGVLGPLLGGVISTRSTWRWIFWLNLPICGAIMIVMAFTWPDDAPASPLKERLKHAGRYDFVGLVLFTAATCLLIIGLEFGGSSLAPWVSPLVLSLLCCSVVCAGAFLAWNFYREKTHTKTQIRALFPASLFKIRLVSAALLICTFGGFCLFVAIVNIPQRYQVVHGDSALIAGVRLSPFLIASAVGSTISGLICAHRNYTFPIVLTACSLVLIGSCLLMQVKHDSKIYPEMYVFQVLAGLGTGAILSSTGYITGINSNYGDYAVFSGIISQCRIFGGCLGLTLSNLILNETFTRMLGSTLSKSQLSSLRQSLEFMNTLEAGQKRAVSDAFAQAFQWQFLLSACVAAMGVLSSLACWTRHPVDLKRRLEIGEKVSSQEVTPEQGDELLRQDRYS